MSWMSAVSGAPSADLFLLERDRELHAVPAPAVTLRARPVLDGSRRLAVVEWEPSPSTLVVSGFEAEEVLAQLEQRAAMGTGAVLVGVADRLLSMAAQYAKERSQFGKPIGSFQAVKHHLADALVRVEFARPMVYRAAWSLSVGERDAGLHASMAKAMASEAATLAARTALQVHGAIGYTWEHDLQLWMKRAWALAASWGDAATHRARVLETLTQSSARSWP
jgi:alkylation response protein AidB-like acyl-CoA dehydrogenase